MTDKSLMQALIFKYRWSAARIVLLTVRYLLQIYVCEDTHSHILIHAEVFTHTQLYLFSLNRKSAAFPKIPTVDHCSHKIFRAKEIIAHRPLSYGQIC